MKGSHDISFSAVLILCTMITKIYVSVFTDKGWRSVVDVNIYQPFLCSRAILFNFQRLFSIYFISWLLFRSNCLCKWRFIYIRRPYITKSDGYDIYCWDLFLVEVKGSRANYLPIFRSVNDWLCPRIRS